MKKTLLSLILFSSLMTLTGCLKGCDKDKKKAEQATEQATEPSTDKKEEPKIEKNSAEMELLEKPSIENANELKQEEKGMNSSARNDMRPDEFWLEEKEDDFGYGEPRRYGDSQRYGERGSRFI